MKTRTAPHALESLSRRHHLSSGSHHESNSYLLQVLLFRELNDAPHAIDDQPVLSVSSTVANLDHLQYVLVKHTESISNLHRQYHGEPFRNTLVRLEDQVHQFEAAKMSSRPHCTDNAATRTLADRYRPIETTPHSCTQEITTAICVGYTQ